MSPRPIDFRRLWTTALRRLRTLPRPGWLLLSACDGDAQRLVAAFDDWCARHRGAVCDLALSGQWVRAIVAPAAADTMDVDELRRYAERQLAHYFADSRAQQAIAWTLAVSHDARTPLVLAIPRATMAALQDAAARHRVRIGRVVPWWLGACSPRAKKASRIVHAREPDVVTTIQVSDGRLVRVAIDLDGGADAPAAAAREGHDVQEIRLRPAGEPPGAVCDDSDVVGRIAASLRRRPRSELDLLGRSVRPWRASWAMLLAAVAVAVTVEQGRDEWLDRQADAQGDLIRALARPTHAGRVGGSAGAGAKDAAAADAQAGEMQAALDMLALRNHRWGDVFAGLDLADASVGMLELAHDAKRRSVDLTLLVPDDEAAWSFAQRLASDSSRFSEASMVTRERLDPPVGPLTTRVRVRAVLKDEGPPTTGHAP